MTSKTPRERGACDAEEYLCQRCETQFVHFPGTALKCTTCETEDTAFLTALYPLDVDLSEESPRSEPEEAVT